MRRLGIDIGSLYIGSVILEDGRIVRTRYGEHKGEIGREIDTILQDPQFARHDLIGVTGNLQIQGHGTIDGTLSVVEGAEYLLPGCRNVFSIGGETFSLILFDENGQYKEHSVNSPCAAGTGSFIEQQAGRLNLSVVELAQRAFDHTGKSPAIATRCAVFAKTDIIHAMQEGYSLSAICAGLCEGIARNALDVLIKGREMHEPVGLVGGVSLNRKIVRTIEEITGKSVHTPEHSHLAGAIGAALLAETSSFDFNGITREGILQRDTRAPLEMRLTRYPVREDISIYDAGDVEVFVPRQSVPVEKGVYIGIDIGSTSTKAVVMNSDKQVVGGFYTATSGQPVAAVKKLINAVNDRFQNRSLTIRGVGTTGSGRKMIRELFQADLEVNEITAHAEAAVFLNPDVDTVIEIGGQDSKFMRIRGGEVYYSAMNYVCAAGTGSFVEEQAKRLAVNLDDFSTMAFGVRPPYTSDRCTVYMERDLSVLLSEGWTREALAAAVLNSVRDNYMAKVVNRSPIGDYVVFQGATARNRALVASFEQLLQKPIHVSPYCHLTGALGVALLCHESGLSTSHFRWDVSDFAVEEEECTLCSNHCSLTVAEAKGTRTAWGMKCGRDYADRSARKRAPSAPEMRFRETTKPLFRTPKPESRRNEVAIGLPHTLYNAAYLPLWYDFLSRLGFQVVMKESSRESLAAGKAIVNADFCAPMIIAHGNIRQFLDDGFDHIFAPAVVNERDEDYEGEVPFREKTNDAYFCYYSQYLPTVMSKLTSVCLEQKLISPLITFQEGNLQETARVIFQAMRAHFGDLELEEVEEAFRSARAAFLCARKAWEQTFRSSKSSPEHTNRPKIVLLGRPYLMFDSVLNLSIPRIIEEMNVDVFWQDEFDVDDYELAYALKYYERMHWHYGKRIVKVAEYCARSDDLFVVYLTCFRCSPDSFLISYVKDIMTHYDKPFLILQLDEHGSDAGYITRIEAGLRSFECSLKKKKETTKHPVAVRARNDRLEKGDTVLVPYIDTLVSEFWIKCFNKAGHNAVLLDPSEGALNTGYQYASGGECMPLVSILGSAVEKTKKNGLDPWKTFFYMPTVCMACNFAQFPILADLVFQSAGLRGLKIGLLNGLALGDVLSTTLSMRLLESNMAGCTVYKMYSRVKPYEVNQGETDRVFQTAKAEIGQAILDGRKLRSALAGAADRFRGVARDESGGRKPKIALLGDLYVKFNAVVNQKVTSLVEELGGELIVPSLTDLLAHFLDADIRLHGDDPRRYRTLRTLEARYEKVAEDLIGDQREPDFAECVALMNEYEINHYIAGETSINVGRALYYVKNRLVDAIIHVNPIFCCPGVVTSSIYRKIQEDFHVPIIDIFYDGSGNPNRVLIPHFHYLTRRSRGR